MPTVSEVAPRFLEVLAARFERGETVVKEIEYRAILVELGCIEGQYGRIELYSALREFAVARGWIRDRLSGRVARLRGFGDGCIGFDILGAVMATGVPPVSENGNGRSGFLDLVVDEFRGEVRRTGKVATVYLKPDSAELHTFLCAWRAKEMGATREQWMNGYPGDRNPDSQRRVKSNVNEKLQVLGVRLAKRVPPKLEKLPT